MDDRTTAYRAPALEKGLDILELLSRQEEALTLNALSEKLNRSKSEIFRMVQVLETRGYLARWAGREGYVLTNKLFMLGLARPVVKTLIELALPEMRRLTEKTGQSCHLVGVRSPEIVILARMDSPKPIGLAVKVGHRLPLAETVSGRLLFAFQTPATQEIWLKDLKAAGLTDKATFLSRVEQVRKKGFEMSASPFIGGVTDISAPIIAPDGTAAAALTVPYISTKSSKQRPATALALTRQAASAISDAMAAQEAA